MIRLLACTDAKWSLGFGTVGFSCIQFVNELADMLIGGSVVVVDAQFYESLPKTSKRLPDCNVIVLSANKLDVDDNAVVCNLHRRYVIEHLQAYSNVCIVASSDKIYFDYLPVADEVTLFKVYEPQLYDCKVNMSNLRKLFTKCGSIKSLLSYKRDYNVERYVRKDLFDKDMHRFDIFKSIMSNRSA